MDSLPVSTSPVSAAGADAAPPAVPLARPRASIRELSQFLVEYCTIQLGMGGQTSRVTRTTERIAAAYGCRAELAVLPRHVILNVADAGDDFSWKASVGTVHSGAPNFLLLAELNALSWQAHDGLLSLAELRAAFHAQLCRKRFQPLVVLPAVALANAAFCRLFGGDGGAMLLVALSTLIGFGLRRWLDARGVGPHLNFIVCAFVASMCVAYGDFWQLSATHQVALGSSVLFLIPGVPLINAMLDVLTGYPLMAFARFVRAGLLVACIGLGLAATLFCTGLDMGTLAVTPLGFGLWGDVLADGLFAAVAAMGFSVVSNPSGRIMAVAGGLAALGHSLRYVLLQQGLLGITAASFVAAFLIGLLSIVMARRLRIAAEFFSFLALLPMVPGMYAYETILAVMRFMEADGFVAGDLYLTLFFQNGLTVLFVMCALAIGATAPLFMQGHLLPPRKG